MTIENWWPRLGLVTREWLIANNGDAVPADIRAQIETAGGPAPDHPWWRELEGTSGWCMPDEAVDWIEETANAEG